jgi:hypothetical protein
MIHYLWWIPSVIIFYVLYAYLSRQSNLYGGKWFAALWGLGIIQLWPLITLVSKNLFFDGILFDIILMTSYFVTLGLLNKDFEKFNIYQWISLGLIAVGMILFKIKS